MNSYIPEDVKVLLRGEEVDIHSESVTRIKERMKGKIKLTEKGKSKLLPYTESFDNEEVTFTINNIEYICKGFDENGDILFEEKE